MTRKFLRTGTRRYKRLGRKKIQRWRKPRGRHNKMREKRKGRPRKVEIGYRTSRKERGKINGKMPVFVKNLRDAEKVERDSLIIIAKVGKKKRGGLLEKIKERGGIILK